MSLTILNFNPEPEINKTKFKQDGKTIYITTKNMKTADCWYMCNTCHWKSVDKPEVCPRCLRNHKEDEENELH